MASSELIKRLAARALEDSEIELIDAALRGSGRNRVVSVTVDKPGGVSIDDCAEASHLVSAVLDAEDPIPGSYRLDVASPGAERPLHTPEEFARVVGRDVEIVRHGDAGTVTGTLDAASASTIVVTSGDETTEIDLDQIARARTIVDFGAARKPKRKKKKTSSPGSHK